MSVVTISQVIMVVYHLHGQTGRFTAWVVGRQHSGLVNFLCRNRLYHLHESSPFTKNDAESLKLISKMALRNCDTHFRLENSNR